jgi:two-component system C4-dicarboxylate transport response regulator DctD
MTKRLVFIVDDDRDHLDAAVDLMDASGFDARGFDGAPAALAALQGAHPDVVVTDLRMPGMDGFALLDAIRAMPGRDIPVIVLTGHGDVPHAVEAIQRGAEDFLEKPYDADHLLMVMMRTMHARDTRAEVTRLRAMLTGTEPLLGMSAAMVELRARIAALAPLDVDVVIEGETGTGKERVARALHAGSPRAGGPWIAVNCAALPEAMFEVEMFGCVAGAFPGAAANRAGKLEAANGGTLVLDEIEAMPPPLQAKLLRALAERQVERLGENRLRPLDLRVLATSKSDLRAMTLDGAFRADLYYRLAGAEIRTTPLRELGGDIALIFAHYANLAAQRYRKPDVETNFALRKTLGRMGWLGNVRELKAAAERYALGLGGPEAEPGAPAADTGALAARLAAYEAREIKATLERCAGNTERAAQVLGLPRRTLNDKMKRFGITS